MVTAMKSKKESEDLAAIQAQLQRERAQLTSEISNRLGSLSPSKSNGNNKNPFKMPSSKDGASSLASSSSSSMLLSSSSPFSQRPATLGLGAEPSEQDRKQAMNGAENARLKGALVGKRKRDTYPSEELQVQAENDEEDSKAFAVQKGKGKEISGKGKGKGSSKVDPFASKKGKASGNKEAVAPVVPSAPEEPSQGELAGLSKAARKRLRKKMKKEAEAKDTISRDDSPAEDTSLRTDIEQKTSSNGHASKEGQNGMTAHQKSLLSHLSGARFRQINETLYTTSSAEAMSYIQGEPLKLREYHDGFREQVKSWPKIPVRQIAELLQKAQAEGKTVGKGKQKSGRYAPGALVVDLGAGEAILAKLLSKDSNSSIRVLSYDLLDSDDGWVKGLDIAKLNGFPLPGSLAGSEHDGKVRIVDVAVFCLSLMGTNWIEMIMEASRVIRIGGELFIAEVSSRFNTKADFIDIVSSLGFRLAHEDTSNSHFVLFEFIKLPKDQKLLKNLEEEEGRIVLIERGASVLKPCIYKRR